jgi:hypothetical protein
MNSLSHLYITSRHSHLSLSLSLSLSLPFSPSPPSEKKEKNWFSKVGAVLLAKQTNQ